MSALLSIAEPLDFVLPEDRAAAEPAEVRGRGRDDVRLLVAWRHDEQLRHLRFVELPSVLQGGDVLVVNTSATLAASVRGRANGRRPVEAHLSTRFPGGLWVVELRQPSASGSQPLLDAAPGWWVELPDGGRIELLAPAGGVSADASVRLWVASFSLPTTVEAYLARHGSPIRYRHVPGDWGIGAYQTVFGLEPGSAEMPSAGRPFTAEMVTRLMAMGVELAPVVLHTGVSSAEAGEPPAMEWFRVPLATARRVQHARREGRRVIAVGTTAVRAIETVADERGGVHPGQGWTDTVITPERGVWAVDGLLTGWHEPRASHLAMLQAVAGRALLAASYESALREEYLWHEFGDVHLILP